MYANRETIPARKPFSLYRLNKISPMDKIKKIIPANEIYIFSMDGDISFTSSTYIQLSFEQIILYHRLSG